MTGTIRVHAVEGDAVMSRTTYFVQECPTCGRTAQIRVEYLGRTVFCRHCRGEFEACDPSSTTYPPPESGIALLRRADELLETVEQHVRVRPR